MSSNVDTPRGADPGSAGRWDRAQSAAVDLFRGMLYIRLVEETIAARYAEQEMRCPVHLSTGQEATAIGVSRALHPTDRVFSSHRCHAHYLAKGGDLRAMFAEIYGRADGCLGGRGGSMHLQDDEKGFIASVPIVGSSIPLAVGTALADRIDRKDGVSTVFFGDAAVEEGVFHESLSFASLHALSVIFVCENNLYSVYTPVAQRQPPRPLTDLARAHAVTAMTADGNDVEAVLAVSHEAVAHARSGRGPVFLAFDTYRWREHCGPFYDNDIGYRTEAEFAEWQRRDPIRRLGDRLRASGALTGAAEKDMTAEIQAKIDAAIERARRSPLPDPSAASGHVYA